MDPQGLAHVVHDQIVEILERQWPDKCPSCGGYLQENQATALLQAGVIPGVTPIRCNDCGRIGVLIPFHGQWAIV
jgi:hypothetical protein